MKKLNNLFTLLSALLLLGACEKDGDTYFLSSPEENELIASASSVVLTKETAKFYALSLAWTDQTLQVSDSRYQPTSGVQTSVQVSRTEDFSGQILETTESGVSKTYSVSALNIVAYQLKATPEEEAPLYFRLAGRNGSNIAPVYSNVVKVMVTPYEIDMRFANIINKGDGKDSGKDLYAVVPPALEKLIPFARMFSEIVISGVTGSLSSLEHAAAKAERAIVNSNR